jgi:hypothetical protein
MDAHPIGWPFNCGSASMGSRVLVVSSDAPLTEMLMAIAAAEGYHARWTTSVTDDAVRWFTPNVIILDASTATSRDDAILEGLDIPVIAVASQAIANVPRSARSFLPIPIEIPALLTALHALCRPQSSFEHLRERRSPSRPRVGDIRPCARCGDAMWFTDSGGDEPAWVCRNEACCDIRLVRSRS